MKILRHIFAALLLAVTAAGCNSTPVRQEERAMEPMNPALKETVERRAAALRQVLAPIEVRGAGVSLNSYRHRLLPGAEVMKNVRLLGFNRIFCRISSEAELGEELRALIIAAAGEKIPVELVFRQGDFKHRFRGNALVRFLLPQFRRLPDLAADIVKFNDSLPPEAKLAGVTVRFEPHLFTCGNGADRIPGFIYIWHEQTFGKGLDNDKLTELSIAVLREMKKNLKGIPLKAELPDFYAAWVDEGKLTRGRPADFTGLDGVLVQCSGNRPSALVKGYLDACAGTPCMAVVPVADHSSVRSGALRRRDWNDMLRALEHFVKSTRAIGCRGVVLRPLSEVGFMLLEQD